MEQFLSEIMKITSGDIVENLLAIGGGIFFLVLSLYNLLAKAEAPKVDTTQEKNDKVVIDSPKRSFKLRLSDGLSKTRTDIWSKVSKIVGADNLSSEQVEELEELLYSADLSLEIVDELIETLKNSNEDNHTEQIKAILRSKMKPIQDNVNKELYSLEGKSKEMKVIMVVGVNGAGKTTTIGKLATRLKNEGAKVVVGACDTFRAAAVEQLEVWCKRANVELVKAPDNSNPTGVAFDTVKMAKELNADYCIIDTAGRLHTAANLMDELAKTKKVMGKVVDAAPHETLLVIDAITGQNALKQAKEFNDALSLTGLVFTKCDGSSKAGSAVSIVRDIGVPIVYIGVGEDVEDLDVFDLEEYLSALVG